MNYNVKVLLDCLLSDLRAVCSVRPSDILVHTKYAHPTVASRAIQLLNIFLLTYIAVQLQTCKIGIAGHCSLRVIGFPF